MNGSSNREINEDKVYNILRQGLHDIEASVRTFKVNLKSLIVTILDHKIRVNTCFQGLKSMGTTFKNMTTETLNEIKNQFLNLHELNHRIQQKLDQIKDKNEEIKELQVALIIMETVNLGSLFYGPFGWICAGSNKLILMSN